MNEYANMLAEISNLDYQSNPFNWTLNDTIVLFEVWVCLDIQKMEWQTMESLMIRLYTEVVWSDDQTASGSSLISVSTVWIIQGHCGWFFFTYQ